MASHYGPTKAPPNGDIKHGKTTMDTLVSIIMVIDT